MDDTCVWRQLEGPSVPNTNFSEALSAAHSTNQKYLVAGLQPCREDRYHTVPRSCANSAPVIRAFRGPCLPHDAQTMTAK
jgi:hypothetical protein